MRSFNASTYSLRQTNDLYRRKEEKEEVVLTKEIYTGIFCNGSFETIFDLSVFIERIKSSHTLFWGSKDWNSKSFNSFCAFYVWVRKRNDYRLSIFFLKFTKLVICINLWVLYTIVPFSLRPIATSTCFGK